MDVSPEHLVTQAQERFQLRDYHGAIYLLADIVETGRALYRGKRGCRCACA